MKTKRIILLTLPALLLCSCEAKSDCGDGWGKISKEAADEYVERIAEKLKTVKGYDLKLTHIVDSPKNSEKSKCIECNYKEDDSNNIYLQVKGTKGTKRLDYEMYYIYGPKSNEEFHVRRYDDATNNYVVESFYRSECTSNDERDEFNDLTQEYRSQFGEIAICYLHDMQVIRTSSVYENYNFLLEENIEKNGFRIKREYSDQGISSDRERETYEKTEIDYYNNLPARYASYKKTNFEKEESILIDIICLESLELTVPSSWNVSSK